MTTEHSATAPAPDAERPKTFLPAPLRAMRPRQWIKNVLVFAAPLSAGALIDPRVVLQCILAFFAFSMASATIYLINDIMDVEEDRLHPRKRFRPIAAGELKVPTAWALSVVTCAIAIGLGFWTAKMLGVTIIVYLVLQIMYTQFLKHQPIIDLAMVASGFLLRAVAGGVAAHIELSSWFLLVASFGSLFMVAGKRYSEMVALGADAGTRRSLQAYTVSYLRFAWHLSAAVTLVSYSLWAFEQQEMKPGVWGVPWTVLSIAPLTIGLLQYAMEVDKGDAGEPEDVVLNHRALQIIGVIWLALVAIAVFVHPFA
ncbi:decaprenyl-phosphate phosphoribosyltransferase [Mariniluteicoccus flavus]